MTELDSVLGSVSEERLIGAVKKICTGERLSNEAEAESFAVMKKMYEEAGCEVTLEHHLGYVSTPEAAEFEAGGVSYACRTHSMTPSAENLRAPLVFVPLRSLNGAAPETVSGKIVLTEGLAMEPVLRKLGGLGAKAAVFITGPFIHNMIVSRTWGSPTPETADHYVKIPAVSVSLSDGEKLKDAAASGAEARLSARVRFRWTQIPCLAAEIRCPGTDDFVMMTGHNDSWHLGAMDNASGNACAAELARIFSPLRSRLKRGIRFVTWSGHSHGRYAGSAAYCDAHFEELAKHCVLNINADCLGGRNATVMTQSPAMASTSALARTALLEAAGVTDWEGCRFSRSCDQSFWGPGVPSLFSQVSEQEPFEGASAEAFKLMFGSGKSGGFGYWWHSTEDTPDKLDPAFLKRDTSVFAAALWHAACEERLPLDAEAEVSELALQIGDWKKQSLGLLDFGAAEEKLSRLSALLRKLKDAPPEVFNRVTRDVLHEVIPLGYVGGSVYRHDDALREPPVPMLREIGLLAGAKTEHERNCLLISLVRSMNRLSMGLSRAIEKAAF